MNYSIIPNYVWDHLIEKMGDNYGIALRSKYDSIQARSTRNFESQLTEDQKALLFKNEIGKNLIRIEDPDKVLHNGSTHPTGICDADIVYEQLLVCSNFLQSVFNRKSFDNRGSVIVAEIRHPLDSNRPEIQWRNNRILVGEPSCSSIFKTFIGDLDVFGHELAHGIILSERKFCYHPLSEKKELVESGALNEHFADVIGIMIKQWFNEEHEPLKASWEIGSNIFIDGRPLRSLKNPSSVDHFGMGPHPSNYKEFDSKKGFHFNSGIPNKAFYNAVSELDEPSWETMGKVWYNSLLSIKTKKCTTFKDFAQETLIQADKLKVRNEVKKSWKLVDVLK